MAIRPDMDTYFMKLARQVAERANCESQNGKRREVGAVLVLGERVIATGYNGTPAGMDNCDEGGCYRCKRHYTSGTFYDICIGVHAEENAVLAAAKHGTAVNGRSSTQRSSRASRAPKRFSKLAFARSSMRKSGCTLSRMRAAG